MTGVHSPAGSGAASASAWVCTGRSSVASSASARWLARSHPLWMYSSWPSGRISDSVTSRSVSGASVRIHRLTAPEPVRIVSAANGSLTNDAAVPAGFGSQSHCTSYAHTDWPVLAGKNVSGTADGSAV